MLKLLKIKATMISIILLNAICFAGTSINTYFSTVDKCDQVVIENINKTQATIDMV